MFRRYIAAALAATALVSGCAGTPRALDARQADPVERSASGIWDPSAQTLDATIDASEYARTLAADAPSVLAECVANGDCVLR